MKDLRQSAPLSLPGVQFSEAEKTTPATGAGIAAMVGLPLAAGIAGGTIALMAAIALRLSYPWRWSAGGFALAGAAVLVLVLENILDLAKEHQVITGVPMAPAPAEAAQRIQIDIREPKDGGAHWRMVDLPGITPAQFAELARGLCLGRPFTESEWCGAGRPFAKAEFRMMRVELLERGILIPRNPQAPAQGFALTGAGHHVMARIAEMTWTPATIIGTPAHASIPAQIEAGSEPEGGRE